MNATSKLFVLCLLCLALLLLSDCSKEATAGESTARGTASIIEIRSREGEWMEFVAFSPDGKKVATKVHTSGTDEMRTWDADSGDELQKSEGWLETFSPEGNNITMASRDDAARIREELKKLEFDGDLEDISLVGKKFVTTTRNAAQIWDTDSMKQLTKLSGYTVSVQKSSRAATVRILNTDSGKVLKRMRQRQAFNNYASDVFAIFSPDGTKVVTVYTVRGLGITSRDGKSGLPIAVALYETTRIWDAGSGKELAKLKEHTDDWDVVRNVVFSPDGKKIVTVSCDSTVRIWDVKSGKELQKMEGEFLAFSPDGKKIAIRAADNSGTIQIRAVPR